MDSSLIVFPSPAERYSVLLDLARTLTGTLAPAELYAGIHAHVSRVLPMDGFSVVLIGASGVDATFQRGRSIASSELSDQDLEHLGAGDFLLRGSRTGTELVVPLARDSRLFGSLSASRREGLPFDASDANFLLAVSQMSGVALDNARLFEAAHKRTEDAERMEAAARELSNSLELATVVERTASWANALVKAPVVVWAIDGDLLRPLAAEGGAMFDKTLEFHMPKPWLAACARFELSDNLEGIRYAAEEQNGSFPIGAREALGISDPNRRLLPLLLGERVIGFVCVGPIPPDSPTFDALRLLRRMAPHAAAAVENARLHDEVRRLSLTDPLVQLPNRRQLDLFLKREFAAAQRGRPLCIVLFDLDRFKEYNDTNGHRAGDMALIKFGDLLRGETRAMNLAARYGGEEFVAVLSETSRGGGEGYAERIRRKLIEDSEGTITVSAGVAEYNKAMDSPIALIVAADRALYRAKTQGRNRVIVAEFAEA